MISKELYEQIDRENAIPPEVRIAHPKLHFCREWDLLLIDEDWPEFEACLCFTPDPIE